MVASTQRYTHTRSFFFSIKRQHRVCYCTNFNCATNHTDSNATDMQRRVSVISVRTIHVRYTQIGTTYELLYNRISNFLQCIDHGEDSITKTHLTVYNLSTHTVPRPGQNDLADTLPVHIVTYRPVELSGGPKITGFGESLEGR